jgi:acyl transferase
MNSTTSEQEPEIVFQSFELPVGEGRHITVWRNANVDRGLREVPILVASGFARRMSAFSPLARYLAMNGFEVFRYDPLDHIGLSSGQMEDFTMSTGLESMRLVADWMLRERGFDDVGIVATSLSARIAYRLVSTMKRVRFLVTAVGVTHMAATLKQVFGEDYSKFRPEDLPLHVEFEKRHKVTARRFQGDGLEKGWWELGPTVEELRNCPVPIASFLGSEDTWVEPADVRAALTAGDAGPRHLYTLTGSGHDLGQNAAIARQFFVEMVKGCIKMTGAEDPFLGSEVVEPSFASISKQMIEERRLQQGNHASPAPADAAPAP